MSKLQMVVLSHKISDSNLSCRTRKVGCDEQECEPACMLVPRYSGIATFFKVPVLSRETMDKNKVNIGILGIPFDAGSSFAPGSRFAPNSIRQASMLIKQHSIHHAMNPFSENQVIDCMDVNTTPFDIQKAVDMIYKQVKAHLQQVDKLVCIGGDHTISYPVIKLLKHSCSGLQ